METQVYEWMLKLSNCNNDVATQIAFEMAEALGVSTSMFGQDLARHRD